MKNHGTKLKPSCDYTVLQQDSFDKRRFATLMEMSKKLQELNEKGSKEFPVFEPLLSDIWASLFKAKPTLKDEVESESIANKSIMENLMKDSQFEKYREFTKLDDLASAMTSLKFGSEIHQWLDEQFKDEEIQQLVEQIQKAQQTEQQEQQGEQGQSNQDQSQQEQQGEQGQSNQDQSQRQSNVESLMKQLGQELAQNMSPQFFERLDEAVEDTQKTIQTVKSLMGGGSAAGTSDPQFERVPLREKISLAEKLSYSAKLKRIAEWAGRMKSTALKKQKSKHQASSAKSGMTLGNDVRLLVPTELAFYRSDVTRKDFLRRFTEKQTLQFEPVGKDTLGKGPIICCMDQSSSMSHADDAAKAFVLSLMMIARKQRRDFCFIPFSDRVGKVYEYPKGKMELNELTNFAVMFMGGGTNFIKPLRSAMEVITKSRYKKADVIFVTDGEASVNDTFLNEFQKVKNEKDFKVLSLVFSRKDSGVKICEQFSEKVLKVANFNDEKCFEAFEI